MKKVLFVLVCAIALVCASCNNSSNNNEAVECDSTAVYVDSLELVPAECDTVLVDTTVVE